MSSVVIAGNTSGSITISAPDVSGSNTLTLPVATDTLVGKATTDTLTNKTLVAPTITGTLTTTGNTILGDASTDTLNVGNGGLVKDASGNVGIGTASPTAKLSVTAGSSNLDLGLLATVSSKIEQTTGDLYIRVSSSNSDTLLQTNRHITFGTGASYTERMRIDSSGNVGIGTASPAAALDVFGRGRIETNTDVNPVLRVGATNGGSATIGCYSGYFSGNPNNTTASFFQGFSSTTTNRISIWSNGNIQNSNNSYGALSDEKLKENIVDATPKLSDLMQVRIRNYNLKYDPEHKQIGVIAQELEQVFPGMIDETSDLDEEGNDLGTKTKAVKYSVFVPMLIKAIQELKVIVDAQAVRIAALES